MTSPRLPNARLCLQIYMYGYYMCKPCAVDLVNMRLSCARGNCASLWCAAGEQPEVCVFYITQTTHTGKTACLHERARKHQKMHFTPERQPARVCCFALRPPCACASTWSSVRVCICIICYRILIYD